MRRRVDRYAGDTIDVAVGPNATNVCDAYELDFTMTGSSGPFVPPLPEDQRFDENVNANSESNGWTFWWNENGPAPGPSSGYPAAVERVERLTIANPGPGGNDSFNIDLGPLSAGATIDVIVNPDGFDTCDSTRVDYTIEIG